MNKCRKLAAMIRQAHYFLAGSIRFTWHKQRSFLSATNSTRSTQYNCITLLFFKNRLPLLYLPTALQVWRSGFRPFLWTFPLLIHCFFGSPWADWILDQKMPRKLSMSCGCLLWFVTAFWGEFAQANNATLPTGWRLLIANDTFGYSVRHFQRPGIGSRSNSSAVVHLVEGDIRMRYSASKQRTQNVRMLIMLHPNDSVIHSELFSSVHFQITIMMCWWFISPALLFWFLSHTRSESLMISRILISMHVVLCFHRQGQQRFFNAVVQKNQTWPRGIVPYEIASDFSEWFRSRKL